MILVIGGSGSGKSAYAEKLADGLAKDAGGEKYYLATMQIFDEESRKKVKRHRDERSGKGYRTLEQPVAMHKVLEKMEAEKSTALLECISNLTANEMFSEKERRTEEETVRRVVRGVKVLKEEAANLVVVTNNVFEDGVIYDEATMAYIRAMGKINRRLAAMADRIAEVIVGIPVWL